MSASAWAATSSKFASGTFVTLTPRSLAAATSTVSRPTPNRVTTRQAGSPSSPRAAIGSRSTSSAAASAAGPRRNLVGRQAEDPDEPAGGEPGVDDRRDGRAMPLRAHLASERHREVPRPDEDDVDAVDGGDLLRRLDSLARLHLHDEEHL